MLQLKNISKTYNPKKGVPVKALDNVSIDFEETGLVFLLGKSGSGKSTLLNIIGGLEIADEGEIVIKGKSSKEFKTSDFDSYRNTFIGFIFQEYNILNDFNVEKNIALALELQGKKATKEIVDNLLDQVDLKGYGKRKINEMSGGQKQRVAIARALIKDPEIIFADEPTGALDSNTGKQVFDTLKKLSKNKLIVVVTHDREFAEYYGDRVIELKDGKIIKDERKIKMPPMEITPGFKMIGENIIQIEKGHKLSPKEENFVIKTIQSAEDDIYLSFNKDTNTELRKKSKIDDKGFIEEFTKTRREDLKIKEYNKNDLKMIKSKMKFKDSFKMGASGLKVKPIRLAFTILLSLVAFGLFGIVDCMSSYNYLNTMARSIKDTEIPSISVVHEKVTKHDGWSDKTNIYLSNSDIAELEKNTGLSFTGVYSNLSNDYSYNTGFEFETASNKDSKNYYNSYFGGLIEKTKRELDDLGFTIIGNLPTADNEIAITNYAYENMQYYGFYGKNNYNDSSTTKFESSTINSTNNVIGKYITIEYNGNNYFKIVGIVNTNLNKERYLKEDYDRASLSNMINEYEFRTIMNYGYHNLLFMNNGFVEKYATNDNFGYNISEFGYMSFYNADDEVISYYPDKIANLTDAKNNDNVDIVMFNNTSNLSSNGILINYTLFKELLNYANSNLYSELFNYYDGIESEYYFYDRNYGSSNSVTIYENYLENNPQEYTKAVANGYNGTIEDYAYDFYRGEFYYDNPYTSLTSKYLRNLYTKNRFNENISKIKTAITDSDYKTIKLKYEKYYSSDSLPIYYNLNLDGVYFDFNDSTYYYYTTLISNDNLYNEIVTYEKGIYNFAVTSTLPNDYNKIKDILSSINKMNKDDIVFSIRNEVSSTLDMVNEFIEILSQVFLYIGIGFAVFASLMLMNFIATSISYKKREIGILRAIGARSKDVFGIFFNESLIIAFINCFLAIIASGVAVFIINSALRNNYGLLITILSFGIRQIALLIAISVAVAFISSIIPVMKISKKKPIDAINNR